MVWQQSASPANSRAGTNESWSLPGCGRGRLRSGRPAEHTEAPREAAAAILSLRAINDSRALRRQPVRTGLTKSGPVTKRSSSLSRGPPLEEPLTAPIRVSPPPATGRSGWRKSRDVHSVGAVGPITSLGKTPEVATQTRRTEPVAGAARQAAIPRVQQVCACASPAGHEAIHPAGHAGKLPTTPRALHRATAPARSAGQVVTLLTAATRRITPESTVCPVREMVWK